MEITRLTVFCGSSPGTDPAHVDTAAALGRELARREIGLVYGGAHLGLMGAVADACLAAGGHVTGIMTSACRRCTSASPAWPTSATGSP
jgi:predicted Rossmann-fold nucleotide-binding protein